MRELACPRGPRSEGCWEQALTPARLCFPGGSSTWPGVPEVCRGVLDLPWHPGALP